MGSQQLITHNARLQCLKIVMTLAIIQDQQTEKETCNCVPPRVFSIYFIFIVFFIDYSSQIENLLS